MVTNSIYAEPKMLAVGTNLSTKSRTHRRWEPTLPRRAENTGGGGQLFHEEHKIVGAGSQLIPEEPKNSAVELTHPRRAENVSYKLQTLSCLLHAATN